MDETAIIEAKLIIDEAYGEVVTEAGRSHDYESLRAEEILLHASGYLKEQIPEWCRDLW